MAYVSIRICLKKNSKSNQRGCTLYQASRRGESSIAVRFSEDEPIESVQNYSGIVDWVWINTNTTLPVTSQNYQILQNFKTCLVYPERWGGQMMLTSTLNS